MHQVEGEYPDYQKYPMKGRFYLDADQSFNPFTWKPPIHWEGYVGGQKVIFTQLGRSGYHVDHFDWQDFPEELESAKPYIVEAIDKAMKKMD